MEPLTENLVLFTFEELEEITEDFSPQNYIGKFQFGKFYRGKISNQGEPRSVTVKIYEPTKKYGYKQGDNELRVRDEIHLLKHDQFSFYSGLVKLRGYCDDGDTDYSGGRLGLVYDLNPRDSLYNFLNKDSFNWLQRINVALRLAYILKFFHWGNPMKLELIVRNLSAGHIMLDEDYNPILCDFSMISGGIFPDKTDSSYIWGCHGYVDSYLREWCHLNDVFTFGVLLLMLITRKIYTAEDRMDDDEPFLHRWAENEYSPPRRSKMGFKRSGSSFVHESLETDPCFCPSDGRKITELAMKCIDCDYSDRPTVRQVIKCLLSLKAVQLHGRDIGFKKNGFRRVLACTKL